MCVFVCECESVCVSDGGWLEWGGGRIVCTPLFTPAAQVGRDIQGKRQNGSTLQCHGGVYTRIIIDSGCAYVSPHTPVHATNRFMTIDLIQNESTSLKTGCVHAAVCKVIQMCK